MFLFKKVEQREIFIEIRLFTITMKSAIYCQVWTSNYLQEIRMMAMMIPIIPRPRNPPMMLVIKRCLNNNILFTILQCRGFLKN